MPNCRTLEVICVRLTTSSGPVITMNVYRPGGETVGVVFRRTGVPAKNDRHLLLSSSGGGDFNVRVQDPNDPDARRLDGQLSSFYMVQLSRGPTHRCGNTLDLRAPTAYLTPLMSIRMASCLTTRSSLSTCRCAETRRLLRNVWFAGGGASTERSYVTSGRRVL